MADLRLLLITHLVVAGAGFAIAPRELLETQVAHNGFFEADTKRVLAAAVESLRSERRLAVYSFKGFAAVSVERDGFLFLNGQQDLIVPASIVYYVDLSHLKVTLDETSTIVTIQLPSLTMGDVAFEPEGASVRTAGLLTWSQAEVEELSKLNYGTARKAFTKQAQGAALVNAAKIKAVNAVATIVQTSLRAAGRPDIKVVASFSASG